MHFFNAKAKRLQFPTYLGDCKPHSSSQTTHQLRIRPCLRHAVTLTGFSLSSDIVLCSDLRRKTQHEDEDDEGDYNCWMHHHNWRQDVCMITKRQNADVTVVISVLELVSKNLAIKCETFGPYLTPFSWSYDGTTTIERLQNIGLIVSAGDCMARTTYLSLVSNSM